MTTPAPDPGGGKLLALGTPIVLADGSSHRLKYGMAGLIALEDSFGTLDAAAQIISDLETAGAAQRGRFVKPLVQLLAAGLAHTGLTYDRILADDLLDLQQLRQYGQAVGSAFVQALPDADPQTAQVETPATPGAGSPGPTGTTSAP